MAQSNLRLPLVGGGSGGNRGPRGRGHPGDDALCAGVGARPRGTVACAGGRRVRRPHRTRRRPAPSRGQRAVVAGIRCRMSLRCKGNSTPATTSQVNAATRAIGRITPSSGQTSTNVVISARAAIASPAQATGHGVNPRIRLGTAIPATSRPKATMCPGPPTKKTKK